ncbi:hypothetical protein HOI18_02765 [Candidatus Uhrbacteria bacterium]|jgi:hypothetical protein|nr:hypothetical protein [Candidatus Uhrbacteria bacterium]
MFDNSHSPWLFHRDEVDLLEDQIEDLYHKHQGPLTPTMTMEQEVLSEQLQTEEHSDIDLSENFKESFVDSMKRSKPQSFGETDISSPLLGLGAHRHPLYRQARDWSVVVYDYAKERYDDGVRTRDVFRVYANVNLVPIKLSVALLEEVGEGVMPVEIAIHEYRLANVYLKRVVDCLAHVGAQTIEDDSVNSMIRIGRKLHKIIEKRMSDLENRQRRTLI